MSTEQALKVDTTQPAELEAKLDEIGSELLKQSIKENPNETDYDSETSEGSTTDEQTFSAESSEDDEDIEDGVPSTILESEETSSDTSNDSASEDTSAGSGTTTSDKEDNRDDAEIETAQTVLPTDRGGGDADQHYDTTDGFTIVDEGTRCGTIIMKIVAKKRQHDPEAYQKWIKAKNEEIRRNREKEKLLAQQQEEQKRREQEQRKELNRKTVQQWMQRKKSNRSRASKPTADTEPSTSATSSEHFFQNDADTRFKVWLKRVKQRDEDAREKKAKELLEKEKALQTRENRKKASQEVYKEWLKFSKNKPRPVPMNRGPYSLKGTVSELFVNPEPWKSNCE